MSMKHLILKEFILEYNDTYLKKDVLYENSLVGQIKQIKDMLLDNKFLPSLQLKQILDKQIRKARYPIEIAITGQFSSGKSTFLNALLSKDILPTGITPVTSKVNFINYGENYKLKVTYNSGAFEYHSIDNIAKFTDQRIENLDDIKYLTIYAPVDILKDISFVDTPGLNSQSQNDTQVTKNILKDVGGIIWLTLIDNAGKMTEQEILDEYMPNFKTKSLCVLNQKDKFNNQQIETTTKYIQHKFSKYFAQITPISAKMALSARVVAKPILIENSMNKLLEDFKQSFKKNSHCKTLKFFTESFNSFQKKLEEIEHIDINQDKILLEESNIQEVLNFINDVMRPNSNEAKEYVIKNDLRNICDILIKEYQTILAVFDSLINILNNECTRCNNTLNTFGNSYFDKLSNVHNKLDTLLQNISSEIYINIVSKKNNIFEKKKTLFSKKKHFIQEQYDSFVINRDEVLKSLIYDDELIVKEIKKVIKQFDILEYDINIELESIYNILKQKIIFWQEQYMQIRKNREIASDLEFSKVRRFSSMVYENILQSFHISILNSHSKITKEHSYFIGKISQNYTNLINTTIIQLEAQITQSEELHKSNPTKFLIMKPREEDILMKLKENFSFHEIDNFLISKSNYLNKSMKKTTEEYMDIYKNKIEFITNSKITYLEKITNLETIKESI